MSNAFAQRISTAAVGVLGVGLVLLQGCQGQPGPQGPQGPAGAPSGGPPYVSVCTPANYFSGSATPANVSIFNGSAATANIAVHFLNKDGNNLAGVTVPGTNPPTTYPGQTGSATVPVASANTLIVSYQAAEGNPSAGGNVLATVRIVSDQPLVAGSTITFSGFHQAPCTLLPK